MKKTWILLISLVINQPFSLHANFSDNPDLTDVSAKYAKLRAKLRVTSSTEKNSNTESAEEQSTTLDQQLNDSSDGCNLNVGNVLIDDSIANPPDEVIVIIEGDIIQSNNCR